jgi:bifunctional UDP-N-acetylglucosamine pyrophosphorylase/glucosamine-1-phosphate N-acetyltransferase
MMSLSAIILAAGKATRMKSERVKVLHEICGRPMLSYVLDACRAVGVKRIFLVIGHDRERVIATYKDAPDISYVVQEEQKGTGHAVLVCKDKVKEVVGISETDHAFVLAGDGPLIRPETLQTLLDVHRSKDASMTIATSVLPDPTGYGRVLYDGEGPAAIVEQVDATEEQRRIQEVYPSYAVFKMPDLFEALSLVKPSPKKGEYYITDTLHVLRSLKRRVAAVTAVAPEDVLAINTRKELADVSRVMQKRIQGLHMNNGVTLVSPENTWIEFGASIGQDTVVEPFCWIGSGASIGAGEHVAAGSVVTRGR